MSAAKAAGLTKVAKDIYTEGYYRAAYEIQRGQGIGRAFAHIDRNTIEQMLARPWAPDGKTFSERIWGSDRSQLQYQLETTLTQGMIRGEDYRNIIRDMAKALNASKAATSRLVMTESAFFAAASRKDCFEQLGVEQYEFLATLDLKTSKICQDLDGKVFAVEAYEIGVTAPPLHPHCRSTTVPYFGDALTQEEVRAARGEDGKTYYVPADMTYREWYEQYVGEEDTIALTQAEERAIMKYISSESYKINDKLRHGIPLTQRERETQDNLDKALMKVPRYQGKLNKSLQFIDDTAAEEFVNTLKVGQEHIFSEYFSTTKKGVYNSDGQVQIYIQNTKQGRDIAKYNENEQEVLYPRKSKFLVLNKRKVEGKYYILLEER